MSRRLLGGSNDMLIVSIVVHLVGVLLAIAALVVLSSSIMIVLLTTVSAMSMSALSMSVGIVPSMVSVSISIVLIVLSFVLRIVLSIISSNDTSVAISATSISASNNGGCAGDRCRGERRRCGARGLVLPLILEVSKVGESRGSVQIKRGATTTTSLHHHYSHDSRNESHSDNADRYSNCRSVGSAAGLRSVLVAVERVLRAAGIAGIRRSSRRLVPTVVTTIAITCRRLRRISSRWRRVGGSRARDGWGVRLPAPKIGRSSGSDDSCVRLIILLNFDTPFQTGCQVLLGGHTFRSFTGQELAFGASPEDLLHDGRTGAFGIFPLEDIFGGNLNISRSELSSTDTDGVGEGLAVSTETRFHCGKGSASRGRGREKGEEGIEDDDKAQ